MSERPPQPGGLRQVVPAAVLVAVVVLVAVNVPRRYAAVVLVGSLVLIQLASSAAISWRNLRSRTYRPLPRFTEKEAEGMLVSQWVWAALLALLWLTGDWTLESVGLRPEVPAWIGLLAGFALYVPLTLLFFAIGRWRYGAEGLSKRWVRAMKRFFPRTPRGRWLVRLGVLPIPFVEEISHRGILVVLLSRESGLLLPVIALGLCVSVALHLYQGPSQIPFHLAFAGLATALALSPLGLWGALGLHVAGDLIPFASFPRAFASLSARRAARGRAVRAAPV